MYKCKKGENSEAIKELNTWTLNAFELRGQ